jgi:hypothetical protein
MFSYCTFRDILCRQFEHFAIHFVVEIINTLFKHQKRINSLNHRFFVRRIRSKNTIFLKRMSRKKFLMRNLQYKRNKMIMISQIMYRYQKRCYESSCDEQFEFFASNWIRELSSFCSKIKHEIKLRVYSSMFLWIKFVFESNYLSLFCAIHVLNFRCDLFISSTWKNFKRLISFIHFIDVKEFKITHLSIKCIFCYTFFVVHYIKFHHLSK